LFFMHSPFSWIIFRGITYIADNWIWCVCHWG
jgi:hypothetical protein